MSDLTTEQMKALNEFHEAFVAGIETQAPPGWVYRDIPWMADKFWDELWALVGEGNFETIAVSRRPDAKRGQFFISPEGMANMRARVAAR